MPGLDGKGPQGQGSMTGRGLGNCDDAKKVNEKGQILPLGRGRGGGGRGLGRGFGRGLGRGVGNTLSTPDTQDDQK